MPAKLFQEVMWFRSFLQSSLVKTSTGLLLGLIHVIIGHRCHGCHHQPRTYLVGGWFATLGPSWLRIIQWLQRHRSIKAHQSVSKRIKAYRSVQSVSKHIKAYQSVSKRIKAYQSASKYNFRSSSSPVRYWALPISASVSDCHKTHHAKLCHQSNKISSERKIKIGFNLTCYLIT